MSDAIRTPEDEVLAAQEASKAAIQRRYEATTSRPFSEWREDPNAMDFSKFRWGLDALGPSEEENAEFSKIRGFGPWQPRDTNVEAAIDAANKGDSRSVEQAPAGWQPMPVEDVDPMVLRWPGYAKRIAAARSAGLSEQEVERVLLDVEQAAVYQSGPDEANYRLGRTPDSLREMQHYTETSMRQTLIGQYGDQYSEKEIDDRIKAAPITGLSANMMLADPALFKQYVTDRGIKLDSNLLTEAINGRKEDRLNVDLQRVLSRMRDEGQTPELMSERQRIDDEMARISAPVNQTTLQWIARGTTSMFSQQSRHFGRMLTSPWTATIMGSSVALTAASAGPLNLLPGAGQLAYGAALAGAAQSSLGAAYSYAASMNTYEAYRDLSYGEFISSGIDQDTAVFASEVVGYATTGAGMLSLQKMLPYIPGIGRFSSAKQIVGAALQYPTTRAAMQQVAKRALLAKTADGVSNALQEVCIIVAGETAKHATGVASSVTMGDAFERVIAANNIMWASMPLMIPGIMIDGRTSYTDARQTRAQTDIYAHSAGMTTDAFMSMVSARNDATQRAAGELVDAQYSWDAKDKLTISDPVTGRTMTPEGTFDAVMQAAAPTPQTQFRIDTNGNVSSEAIAGTGEAAAEAGAESIAAEEATTAEPEISRIDTDEEATTEVEAEPATATPAEDDNAVVFLPARVLEVYNQENQGRLEELGIQQTPVEGTGEVAIRLSDYNRLGDVFLRDTQSVVRVGAAGRTIAERAAANAENLTAAVSGIMSDTEVGRQARNVIDRLDADMRGAGRSAAEARAWSTIVGTSAMRLSELTGLPVDTFADISIQQMRYDAWRARNTGAALNQEAYHGSSRRFSEFSTDEIGSGAGMQMYGWGLYFAESRTVADMYRKTLSPGVTVEHLRLGNMALIDGGDWADVPSQFRKAYPRATQNEYRAGVFAFNAIQDMADLLEREYATGGEDAVKAMIRGEIQDMAEYSSNDVEGNAFIERLLADVDNMGLDMSGDPGQLYQVSVPESDVLLDYDNLFTEQPEAVQRAVAEIFESLGEDIDSPDDMTGREVYETLSRATTGDEAASRELNARGVEGLQYLDGGALNYVVFNDAAVEVLNTYYQGRRDRPNANIQNTPGLYDSTINLFETANQSSAHHEYGHHLFNVLANVRNLEGLDADFAGLIDGAFEDIGVSVADYLANTDREQITAAQERGARMWEAYLATGKAPSPALQTVFGKIRAWLIDVYKDITQALGVEVSNNMKDLFDTLLATPEEQEAATIVSERASELAAIKHRSAEVQNQERVLTDLGDTPLLDAVRNNPISTDDMLDAVGEGQLEMLPAGIDSPGSSKTLAELAGDMGFGSSQELVDALIAEQDALNEATRALEAAAPPAEQPSTSAEFERGAREGSAWGRATADMEYSALLRAYNETRKALRQGNRDAAREAARLQAQIVRTEKQAEARFLKAQDDVALTRFQRDVERVEAREGAREAQRATQRAEGLQGRLEDVTIQRNIERVASKLKLADVRRAETTRRQAAIQKLVGKQMALNLARRTKEATARRVTKQVARINRWADDSSVIWAAQQEIKDMLSGYDLRYRTKKTLDRRAELLAYYDNPEHVSEWQASRDDINSRLAMEITPEERATLHKERAKLRTAERNMKYLGTTTLGEMTTAELGDLYQQVGAVHDRGKAEYKLWTENKKLERAERLRPVYESVSKTKPKVPAVLKGEAVRAGKEYKGLAGFVQRAEDAQWALTLDRTRLLNWFDGDTKDYSGPMFELLGREWDTRTSGRDREIFTRKDKMTAELQKLGFQLRDLGKTIPGLETEGTTWTYDEAMHLYIGMKNKYNRDAILYGTLKNLRTANFAERESIINKVIGALTEQHKRAAELVVADFDASRPRINARMIETMNAGFDAEENYVSMLRAAARSSGPDLLDASVALEMRAAGDQQAVLGSLDESFTLSRQEISPENQQPIVLGLFSVWGSQMAKQEHTAAMAGYAQDVASLIYSKNPANPAETFGQMITSRFGDTAWKALVSNENVMLRDGVYEASTVLSNAVTQLTGNTAQAALAYNIATAFKQSASFPRFLPHAGATQLARALGSFLKSPSDFLARAFELDPQLRAREGDAGLQLLRGRMKPYMEPGFRLMAAIDRATASIGFVATYEANLLKGLSQERAISEATRAVNMTQIATTAKDKAYLWKQHAAFRAAMLFTGDASKRWNIATYDLAQAMRQEGPANKIQQTIYTGLGLALGAMMAFAVSNGLPIDDEDDTVDVWLARSLGGEALGIMPLVGGWAASQYDAWITGSRARPSVSNAFIAPVERAQRAAGIVYDATQGQEEWYRGMWYAVEAMSYIGGKYIPIPAVAGKRVINGLGMLYDGELYDAVLHGLLGQQVQSERIL